MTTKTRTSRHLIGLLIFLISWPAVAKETKPLILKDLNAVSHDLVTEAAGKILVIQIWASWCFSCGTTLGKVLKYMDDAQLQDKVKIVTVSIDDDVGAARGYMAKHADLFRDRHLTVYQDPNAEQLRHVKVAGVPTTLVVREADSYAAEHGVITQSRFYQLLQEK